MSKDRKNIIKVASVYTGTVVGAGFASGQEIKQFFVVYGYQSIYGILLSSLLFALMGMVILNKIYYYKIKSYSEYVVPLIGKKLGSMIEIIVWLFLLASFNVMVAGSGAVFYEEFGVHRNIGILIMAALCLIVFLNDLKGVVMLNTILAPIMTVGIVFLGIYVLVFKDTDVMSMGYFFKQATNHWFFSSLLYVSYNTLTIIVVMTTLLPLLSRRKVAICGGIAGGIFLGCMAFLLWGVLMMFYNEILPYEIPLLYIVTQKGRIFEWIYVFVLYSAMFTTAVANGYGFLNHISGLLKVNKKLCAFVLCAFSVPCAYIGFENLVKNLYSFFGYLGLFMMIVVLVDGVKELFYIWS